MKLKSSILKDMIALVSTLTDEADIVGTATDWSVYTLSADRTAMALVTIPYTAFDEPPPAPAEGEEFRMTVKLDKLSKAVKISSDEVLDIEVGDRCVVKGGGMTSRIPLLVNPEVNRRFPDLELETCAMISSSELVRMVKAVDDQVAMSIEVSQEGVTMKGKADADEMSVSLHIPADDCLAINGEAKATYSVNALKDFVGAVPKGVPLTISLETDYPVNITYTTDAGLEARWLAAPWIDSEEDGE